MKIVVVTNDELKSELLQQGIKENLVIEWHDDLNKINGTDASVCIDLLFSEYTKERITVLNELPVQLIIVNYVNGTSENLPASFIRINGWNTLLKRAVVEAASKDEKNKTIVEEVFDCFNKKTEWTEDLPGFITARVISMIINEAYYALNENISTKEEIDTAMKMGTNYPYGPFEWCKLIGIKKVYGLLDQLTIHNPRYQPSDLLKTEATS
ncbi:MAG: 3-hydroxyacyl-CoA dehydrogenase family protein [Bacteroidota bacterium]